LKNRTKWVTLAVAAVFIGVVGWIAGNSEQSSDQADPQDLNGDGIPDELQALDPESAFVVDFDRPLPSGPDLEMRGYGRPACTDNDGDGYTTCAGDCDDGWQWTNPKAPEGCDDKDDNDCDGLVDQKDPDCATH
jgi:hypothetical protein